MKNTILILSLLTSIFNAVLSHSQDLIVNIEGVVLDIDSIEPVQEHLVIIEINSTGVYQQFELYTDDSGYFYKDSIFVNGSGTVLATTFDCLGFLHVQEDFISPANTNFWFDFYICTDTNQYCQAFFDYELIPGLAPDVLFMNLSTGNYDNLLWDFGDGNTSIDPNPLHIYDFPGTYFVCLTIWNEGGNCQDQYCQDVIVTVDCENWFDYFTNDNQTFDFSGFSFPQAEYYFWDFGDGQTADGQNVSHTYESGINDWLPVTLMTYDINPVNDTCIAFSEQWIMVGNGSFCIANYTYNVDSSNNFSYSFTDNSTGPVTNYFWDFGDGNFSEEMNPVHVFQAPETYNVCLTIFSDSAGFICIDTYCEEIFVDYTLTAGYSAVLDTLSNQPNMYYFFDNSIGEPDSWYWDFGDGQVSLDQNPVHQFESGGTYEICLLVNRSFAGGNNFEDEFCLTVETPQYFDLGGQVYLDDIPMNNFNGDTTVVDTGLVYLYRKYYNTLIPVDTQSFYTYGYYWFSQVRAGNYIVRVRLTGNSLHYEDYVPAYHENTILWPNAETIALQDSNLYFSEVRLQPLLDIPAGTASLSGYVVYSGSSNPLMTGLDGIEVFLLGPDFIPIDFSITDQGGEFSFDGLPPGIYVLYSEATGLFTYPTTLEIDEPGSSINNIQLQLFQEVVGTINPKPSPLTVGQIFPNPVNDWLSLDISLNKKSEINISIYSTTGQKIYEKTEFLNEGDGCYTIQSQEIPSGLYILTISLPADNMIRVRKFIK